MPCPATGSKTAPGVWTSIPRSMAAVTMGRARGCSLPVSARAARASRSCSMSPSARGITSVRSGRPSVRVPVLSKATAVIVAARSRCSPPLIRMPSRAPRPMPATMETGIEMTSAPGHPITSRVSASSMLPLIRPETMASTMMAGVYHFENRSMNAWVRALASWASSTRRMIRARVVSAPMARVVTRRYPLVWTVPAKTGSPGPLAAGMDSPVMLASFTAASPSTTSPSTGTMAPALTMTTSPACTEPAGTSVSTPSRMTTATSGAVSTRSASADRVLARVTFSSA